MTRISFVPSFCIRGMARFASAMDESNGSSIFLPQFAIADPKQLTPTSACWSLLYAISKSSSLISWMFLPSMLRASIHFQPSSFVALIWLSMPLAASSAKPVRYISLLLVVIGAERRHARTGALVGGAGIEPATSSVSTKRSPPELTAQKEDCSLNCRKRTVRTVFLDARTIIATMQRRCQPPRAGGRTLDLRRGRGTDRGRKGRGVRGREARPCATPARG